MMNSSNEQTVFTGKLGEVVHTTQPDGRVFEQFRRPPGTRLIIVSPEQKILLTKEYRQETDSVDLRLPGGKVCDSLAEYHQLIESGADLIEAARAGATVQWDLYYFLCRSYQPHPEGQHLEHGEDIEVVWLSIDDLRHAIGDGQMQEWRSVGVLLGKVLPMFSSV